jgi:hypothetical protein
MGLAFGVGTPSKTKKVCAPRAASAFLHAPFPARRGGKAQLPHTRGRTLSPWLEAADE